MRGVLIVTCVVLLAAGCAAKKSAPDDLPSALRNIKLKPYALVPGAPQMEPWSGGPVWRDGEVFFANRPFVRVTKDGRPLSYLDLHVDGTFMRGNGHILLCEQKTKALLDVSPSGVVSVIAEHFDGSSLPGLNDVTADANGNVYWTSPQGSSVENRVGKVFRVTPSGAVELLASDLAFPNGIEVDPESRFLYVVESQTRRVLRYDLPAEGEKLGAPSVFFDLGPDSNGGDGCAFDQYGNLWIAEFSRKDANGRLVVVRPDGTVLGEVKVPAKLVTNLWFGGRNQDELFVSTGNPSGIFHGRVRIPGFKGHPATDLKRLRRLDLKPLNKPLP